MKHPRSSKWRLAAVLGLLSMAAGCNDTAAVLEPQAATTRIAAKPGVSPSGATIAFASLEGAPAPIVSQFSQYTLAEAQRRQVSIAQPNAADYLVRGYLSAASVPGGAAFSYVLDVFDKRQRRIQRTEDVILVPGAAADPWQLATPAALGSLAARSADDLAAVMSNTPEAAQANAAGAIARAAAPAPASAALPAEASAFR